MLYAELGRALIAPPQPPVVRVHYQAYLYLIEGSIVRSRAEGGRPVTQQAIAERLARESQDPRFRTARAARRPAR